MTLQQLLGIELPLIQAPMAGAQGSALAIAARTAKPYNVNFFCHTPPTPEPAREAAWRVALAPYYAVVSDRPGNIPAGPGRNPFDTAAANVLTEFKPAMVSFHFGLPSPDCCRRPKTSGRDGHLYRERSSRRQGSRGLD